MKDNEKEKSDEKIYMVWLILLVCVVALIIIGNFSNNLGTQPIIPLHHKLVQITYNCTMEEENLTQVSSINYTMVCRTDACPDIKLNFVYVVNNTDVFCDGVMREVVGNG